MTVSKSIKNLISKQAKEYYGKKLNIVQVYPDPKVSNTYIVRVEDDQGNWCFVVNYGYGDSIDDAMIDDFIELEPKQKINKSMFGDLRFF